MNDQPTIEQLQELETPALFDMLAEKMALYTKLLTENRYADEFLILKETISRLHVVLEGRMKKETNGSENY